MTDFIAVLLGIAIGGLIVSWQEWNDRNRLPVTITIDGLNGKVYRGVNLDTLDAVHAEIRRDVIRMQLGCTRDRLLARQFRKTTEG